MSQTTQNFFVKTFLGPLKLWNRRRLHQQRIQKLLSTNEKEIKKQKTPERILSLLVIDARPGWGDFLYHLGLIHELTKNKIIIDIATPEDTYKRFLIPMIRNVYSLDKEDHIQKCSKNHYDACIDLTYVNLTEWNKRLTLLKQLNCHTITIGNITSLSSYFSEYIDISNCPHESERMALIASNLLNKKVEKILPYFPISEESTSSEAKSFINYLPKDVNVVYVNTIAREADRCLSEDQVNALITFFKDKKDAVGIFNTEKEITTSDSVKKLPNLSFDDFASIVKHCEAVITPDTSATHLATAFSIPSLVFFCANDRDYFPQHAMSDVWAPLAEGSLVYKEDDDVKECAPDRYFYMHPVRPISDIKKDNLIFATKSFLEELPKKTKPHD